MSEDAFHSEVLKLLVHIAWADGVVEEAEIAAIKELGLSWNVPPAELEQVVTRLQNRQAAAAPNMQLLRANPRAVMNAVREVVMSDGRLDLEELDVLGTVAQLLGVQQD